jgi:hypothetical protein
MEVRVKGSLRPEQVVVDSRTPSVEDMACGGGQVPEV